jgi:hypothetical protein
MRILQKTLFIRGPAQSGNGSRGPRLARVIGGMLTTLLFAAPCLLIGRWTAEPGYTPLQIAASTIGGIVFMVVAGALVEWLVHQYILHRPSRISALQFVYHIHHRAHHWVHFPPHDYVQSGAIEYPSLLSAKSYPVCGTTQARVLTVTAYALFYSSFAVPILTTGWLLTSNPWFIATSTVTAATLVFLLIRVHDAIHFPGVSHLEKFRWFRFLDHHHYIHHIDNRANTNFLLPLGDFLMGTLRLELNAREKAQWPSYEEARKLPTKAQRKADLMQPV